MHLPTCVNEVSQLREACGAFDKTPHVPIADASPVSMFNGKLHARLLFSNDPVALHAIDVLQVYSLDTRSVEESPRGVGRLSRFADWRFSPATEPPDG